MILKFSQYICEKSSNIKSHEIKSSGSRVVPCGQTYGRTEERTDRHVEADS